MSIKSQGGVFGRNPTFNEVTVEGGLSINGQVISKDSFKLTGNVNTPTGNAMFRPASNTLAFATNSIEQVRIDSSGHLNMLGSGNVVMNNGSGIDFSATAGTGTSELFDDYEEGTWTPVVSDGTNDATMGANNGGKYTKVGNLVTISAQVTVGTIDSVGANARITGLPFTNVNSTASRAGIAFGFGSSLAITAGRVVTGYVEINQAFIELQYWDAATGTTGLDGSEITNGGALFLSGHYYVS